MASCGPPLRCRYETANPWVILPERADHLHVMTEGGPYFVAQNACHE